MPVIRHASIQLLKSRVDLVEVVSSVVSLKRAGSKFKGLSPFNPEKTPSFFVSPDKGLYKCFSSGKAGDVISFVMETERLGFTEAVESLARRFNVPLEYESGGLSREERSLRQELFDLHEEAAQAYRDAFLASTEAGRFVREYWSGKRRFTPEVAEDFKIGCADPDGGRLLERLRKRGFSDDALRQCGLFFVRGTLPLQPRFRGRLTIPIRDFQGRIVAFTARQLEITPADDPAREAKYVNSPETPIFVKGQLLFNLDRARKHAGPGHPFLMVEGQLDAIRCWTAGLTTVIAPQGTGVTETQLHLLRRYHAQLECLLDGDAAGQKAALRLLPLALREGLEVSFLPLPNKADPDELIRERGLAAIDELRRTRMDAMTFATTSIAPNPAAMAPQELADACAGLFEIVAQSTSEIAQSQYVAEIARLLRLQRSAVDDDYRRYRSRAARRAPPAPSPAPEPESSPSDPEPVPSEPPDDTPCAERDLLLLLLHAEELGEPLAHAIDHHWIDTSTRPGRLLDRFLADFSHKLWPGVQNLKEHLDDPADRRLLASLVFDKPDFDDPIKVANDGIRQMVSNFCAPKIRNIELEIAAKAPKFDADLISLLKANEELRRLRLNPPAIRPPV
jgi:DNA primase